MKRCFSLGVGALLAVTATVTQGDSIDVVAEADAYIQMGATGGVMNWGGDDGLVVKNAGTARKSYVRFALPPEAKQATTAELRLSLRWCNLAEGQSAQILVYAINDGPGEDWVEGEGIEHSTHRGTPDDDAWLTWRNAPANDQDDAGHDDDADGFVGVISGSRPGTAEQVGVIELTSQSKPQETVTISGDALLQAVRADRNGQLTVILVRQSPDDPNVNTGFFSREADNGNPTDGRNDPPTLRLGY